VEWSETLRCCSPESTVIPSEPRMRLVGAPFVPMQAGMLAPGQDRFLGRRRRLPLTLERGQALWDLGQQCRARFAGDSGDLLKRSPR